ncbi:MAG: peroxiredoxin family protein [Rubripirellula sp.]
MKQLVQLQKHADEFKKLNAEMLFVFREESDGVNGLKKIKSKHKTTYRLAFDSKKSSKAYSPKKMTFDNYVIAADGTVAGIVDGTLRDRATADELKKILQEIQ